MGHINAQHICVVPFLPRYEERPLVVACTASGVVLCYTDCNTYYTQNLMIRSVYKALAWLLCRRPLLFHWLLLFKKIATYSTPCVLMETSTPFISTSRVLESKKCKQIWMKQNLKSFPLWLVLRIIPCH